MSNPLYILHSSDVAARRIGDELMIMLARDSSLFSLNETAALLWQAADGKTPLAEIVAHTLCNATELTTSRWRMPPNWRMGWLRAVSC